MIFIIFVVTYQKMKSFILVLILFISNNLIAQQQFALYFNSNKFDISKIENAKLKLWISQNNDVKIVAINGYTDEDGTNQFNDSLAKKRVDFVFNLVKNQVEIRDDFKTRSFGENFKQSINKAENRKVTIYYILKNDLARENEILGIKPVEIKPKVKVIKNFVSKMQFENPDGTVENFNLDVDFMKSIDASKVGDKLKLNNLNFVINTFIVTNVSRPKMYELFLVMKQNPKLKIEIQGNLCCQPIDRVNLSTERAKAIYTFLVFKGIEKSRMTYKGFGSTNPIFALPEKSEEERAANRRVEILILDNE